MSTLNLPITVNVGRNGAVSVDHPHGVLAMSPYSERAKRLTLEFGPGTHPIRTPQDVEDLGRVALDLLDALT